MIPLGFTGTRAFTRDHLALIDPLHWQWFSEFDTFITGGCRGFDAIIGERLVELYPEREHVVIVPSNLSQVDPWWLKRSCKISVTLVQMSENTTYRDRNFEIVRHSVSLFYAAKRLELAGSELRSGTWQTIRLAKAQDLPLQGIVLDPTPI